MKNDAGAGATQAERLAAKAEAADMKALRRDYARAMEGVHKGRAVQIDAYLGDERARTRPLIVFNHIKKTAGTAMVMVMHGNLRELEHAIGLLPRRADRHQWWREFYAEKRDRLVAVAGHDAGFMLSVVDDRPVHAFTLLRNPVDRVLSRYYFLVGHRKDANRPIGWSLEKLYEDLDAGADATSTRAQEFCNGQARSILDPHYDVLGLPLLAGDPAAPLWRDRLFELVDQRYVVGVQEHFAQSVERFADAFGWEFRRAMPVRVNRGRPAREELGERARDLILRYNWLDEELHRRAAAEYEARGAAAPPRRRR